MTPLRFAIRSTAALLLAGFAVLTAGAQSKDNDAVKPAPRPQDGWVKRHTSFVERAKKGDVDVLFVGDSITQGWEGAGKDVWNDRFAKWKPANFGIGGDRTQHVLWRIIEGKELDGIDPKVIVLMIGTNNFGSNTPEEVSAGVAAIVGEFRKQKPSAKVLLLGVFPRSSKAAKDLKDPTVAAADELHKKTAAVNATIAKLDDGKSVFYLDIGPKFLDEKGGLPKATMPDFLHLSPAGYKIWADAIGGRVEELLAK